MNLLGGKKILLGISGGIAAYKTPLIVRELIKNGAEVRVVVTPAAKDFVTPLTLSTLSKNPVLSTFTANDFDNPIWNDHVELGLWADILLIAPATSNTISSMSNGRCNNLLLAVYLSAKCPTFVAPSMDLDMYAHPSNQKNILTLKSYGNKILPVDEGQLASGLEGKGRMLEPQEIIENIITFFNPKLSLKGRRVLITAGPTHEAIDPVRFIGNYSSGKMGFEIAKAAANLGAEVFLIAGPSEEHVNNTLIPRINVVTAEEMYEACHRYFSEVTIAILSAAVADYKPKKITTDKIKKKDTTLELELAPTKDILASLGAIKQHQYLVGFALETSNEIENALSKLERKNLDAIVLNSLKDKGAGFASDTNKITFIDQKQDQVHFELKSKTAVAKDIMNEILNKLDA